MKNQELAVFVLGIASFAFGPFTSIPGVIIGRRLADRGALGHLGYVLCWFFSLVYALAIILGFLAGLTFPLWKGYMK